MALELEVAKRVFIYDGNELEDIPGMSVERVFEVYKDVHPELTSGSISEPEISEDGKTATYTFERHVGKKG